MENVAPAGPVYQAGTLSGNPLAMAAGLATVHSLEDETFYDRLKARGHRLAEGLKSAALHAGAPVTVNECTGMLTLFFTEGPVRSLADAQASDTNRYGRFFHAMLERGIYLPPSQFEAWMLSASHSDEVIDRTIEAAASALQALG